MQLQKIIIVLGPPGSGKGTQSELIAKFLNVPRIVLGDLIRAFGKEDSDQAREAKQRLDKGIPQPDEIATMLLERALKTVSGSEVAIFDTYPLSMGEAEALDRIVAELGAKELRVIYLNVHKEEVIKRISNRNQARTDDKPEIAAARFDEYEKRNAPIKEFYKNKEVLLEINGDQPVADVQKEIRQKLSL